MTSFDEWVDEQIKANEEHFYDERLGFAVMPVADLYDLLHAARRRTIEEVKTGLKELLDPTEGIELGDNTLDRIKLLACIISWLDLKLNAPPAEREGEK